MQAEQTTDPSAESRTLTADQLPPESDAPLDVHVDGRPSDATLIGDPPPAELAQAPSDPGEVEAAAAAGPAMAGEDVAAMAGTLFATCNELLVDRVFPGQPLSEKEKNALAEGCGPLIAYYLPQELSPVMMKWVAAFGALSAVYLPRIQAQRAAQKREKTDMPASSVMHGSPDSHDSDGPG